jgi:hypothetical protein
MISDALTSPETLIEFVSKFTWHTSTPERVETAFSTLAEQAAQLMPNTSNFISLISAQTSQ